MGGLEVIPNTPDPSYRWEMIYMDTGGLFLHFDVSTLRKTVEWCFVLAVKNAIELQGRTMPRRGVFCGDTVPSNVRIFN